MKKKLSNLVNSIFKAIGCGLGLFLSLLPRGGKIRVANFSKFLLSFFEVFSTVGYRVFILIDAAIDVMTRVFSGEIKVKQNLRDGDIFLTLNNVPSRTMYLGVYEKLIFEYFENSLRSSMTFLDVGANIGYYSLLAAQLVGDDGVVLAFEPEAKNFSLLKENIELNSYKNVIAFNSGLGYKSENAVLYIDTHNTGAHSIESGRFNTNKTQSEEILIVAFDNFIAKSKFANRKIDVVKIDVEGFEYEVLLGMKQTIIRDNPIIICEVSNNQSNILDLFKSLGYKVSYFDHRKHSIVPCEIDFKVIGKKDYLFSPR